MNLKPDLRAEIMSRVTRDGACWAYKSIATTGSPGIMWGKRRYTVHRLLWEDKHGQLRNNQCLHQTCETPHCVNPEHFTLARRGARWIGWVINANKETDNE